MPLPKPAPVEAVMADAIAVGSYGPKSYADPDLDQRPIWEVEHETEDEMSRRVMDRCYGIFFDVED